MITSETHGGTPLQILAMMVAAWLMVDSGTAGAEQRVALVIGNAEYKDAPLKNPVNDARDVAGKLRDIGFDVILRENATKPQLEQAISEFGEKLREGAVAMVFYSGHGMQVQGRNFLIPTDARIASEQQIRLQTVDVDIVLDQMAAARSRVNLVILDACRNNPFERRFRGLSGGLAQMNAPEGTMIAYATAPGKVASDGEGRNGLYTEELLKAIDQQGSPIEDVFKHVRTAVMQRSSGAQTPWESSSLTGDFYFKPTTAPPAAVPSTSTADKEALFWETIKNSQNPATFRAYLGQYPKGAFAELATIRIGELNSQTAGARPPQPPPQRQSGDQQAGLPPANPPEPNSDHANGPPVGDETRLERLRQGATAGQPRALVQLGHVYENGRIVAQDFSEAARWYRKAAELGDPLGMVSLGHLSHIGRGAPQDDAQAVALYRKAADQGNSAGQAALAFMLRKGLGVPRSFTESLRFAQLSAAQGNPHGQLGVGVLYEAGEGVRQDFGEALKWYRAAANQESPDGFTAMGHLYETGRGVPKDIKEAERWYRKAADHGNPQAKEALSRLMPR